MAAPTPNDAAQLKPIFRLVRKISEDAPLEALPPHWQRVITRLRRESAKARIDLRGTRQELAEAQKRIAEQIADIADLKDELKTAVASDTSPTKPEGRRCKGCGDPVEAGNRCDFCWKFLDR